MLPPQPALPPPIRAPFKNAHTGQVRFPSPVPSSGLLSAVRPGDGERAVRARPVSRSLHSSRRSKRPAATRISRSRPEFGVRNPTGQAGWTGSLHRFDILHLVPIPVKTDPAFFAHAVNTRDGFDFRFSCRLLLLFARSGHRENRDAYRAGSVFA